MSSSEGGGPPLPSASSSGRGGERGGGPRGPRRGRGGGERVARQNGGAPPPPSGGEGGRGGPRRRGRGRGRGGHRGQEDSVVPPPAPETDTTVHVEDEEDASRPCCVICTEELDQGKHRPAVGSCDHSGTCALCFMRLRLLVGDMGCPLCKAVLEQVYVFDKGPSAVRPFSSLQIWDNNAGPDMVWDDRAEMFLPKAFYQEVFLPIQSFRCREDGCTYQGKNAQGLRAHVREKHDLHLCEVCLEHKKAFTGESVCYSKKALAAHMEKGEPSAGFMGHPPCKFCKNKRFYDSTSLFEHLRRAHYSCDVCERQRQQQGLGPQHRYYADYADLERHFRREHHLCEDTHCLAQRFVVFAHPLDLQAHTLNHHPGQAQRRLELDVSAFRVRGQQGMRGSQGTEDLGEDGEREWMPTRLAPSLSSRGGRGGGGGAGRRGASTSATTTAVDLEAFPALSAEATHAGLARAPAGSGGQHVTSRWSSTTSSQGGANFPTLGPPRAIADAATRPTPSPRPSKTAGPSPLQRALGQLPKPVASSAQSQQKAKEEDPMLARNRRFAEALGIANEVQGQAAALARVRIEGDRGEGTIDAFQLELERPVYPRELLAWASSAKMEVVRLEKKIADFLADRKEASLYLKPMPREERKRVHQLAEFYGLQSVSYDAEPKRFVALIKAPGSTGAVRPPVVLLSEAASANMMGTGVGIGRRLDGIEGSTAMPLIPARAAPPAATLLVTNIGEQSGKVITDRLRELVPSLQLLGYHFREEAFTNGMEPSPPALVVELGSVAGLAALLDEGRAHPEILYPFHLKSTTPGLMAVVKSILPEGMSVPPPPPKTRQPADESQSQQQRWGTSVLAGRLKPRSLPVPTTTTTTTTTHAVTETRPTTIASLIASSSNAKQQHGKVSKQGGKKRGGPPPREEEVDLRPGQAIASNRWAGLVDDEDEEEGKGGENEETAVHVDQAAPLGKLLRKKTLEEEEDEEDQRDQTTPGGHKEAEAQKTGEDPRQDEEEEEEDCEEEDDDEEEEEEDDEELPCPGCGMYKHLSPKDAERCLRPNR